MGKRRTRARVDIAVELLRDRRGVHWGYELSRKAGVGAGSMYPFLGELFDSGFLTDGWEDPAVCVDRPPRRYYRLTDDGIRYLLDFVGGASAGVKSRRKAGSGVAGVLRAVTS